MPPVQHTAAAPALQPAELPARTPEPVRLARPQLVETPSVARPSVNVGGPAVQPSLFGPVPVKRREQEAPTPRHGRRDGAGRVRRSEPAFSQAELDFSTTTDGARTLPTSVEANVYCDAPVAVAAQRLTATAIDLVLPAAGFAIFLVAARWIAADLPLSGPALPYLAGAAVLLGLFYRLICAVGNMDTLGLQWAGLRLLDFDGRLPKRKARLLRLGGALVSLGPLGMGFVWSLFDEEHLSWPDLISGTFPTYAKPEKN